MTISKKLLCVATLGLCLNTPYFISAYDGEKLQKEILLISKFIDNLESSTGKFYYNENLKRFNSELSELVNSKNLANENVIGFKEAQQTSEFINNRILFIEQHNKVVDKNNDLRYWLKGTIESTYITSNDEIIKIANIIETNNPSIEEELFATKDMVNKRHDKINAIIMISLFAAYATLVFKAYVK